MADCMYSCKLDLAQDDCNKREHDPGARAQQFGGCPTCTHREPASPETRAADAEFEQGERWTETATA
jgi:hypothetical protein